MNSLGNPFYQSIKETAIYKKVQRLFAVIREANIGSTEDIPKFRDSIDLNISPEIYQKAEQIYHKTNKLRAHGSLRQEVEDENWCRTEKTFFSNEVISRELSKSLGELVDCLVFRLREGRSKDGAPYVLCVDEISDYEVLSQASVDELVAAFEEAVKHITKGEINDGRPHHLDFETSSGLKKTDFLFLSSLFVGMLFVGCSLQESLERSMALISEAQIEKYRRHKKKEYYHLPDPVDFTENSSLIQQIVSHLLNYFNDRLETDSNDGFQHLDLAHELAEGKVSINLGEGFTIPDFDIGQLIEGKKSQELLRPFLEAVKISRQKMFEVALQFAEVQFGKHFDDDRKPQPPLAGGWKNILEA